MRFSLVVTTLNRPQELSLLLRSLAAQEFKDFEVVLVDQNEVPQNLDGTPGLNCRVLHLGRPCGASVARNAGLALATGEIIAFPDDDCAYMPDTLRRANEFFSRHPEYGGVVAKWKSSRRGEIGKYDVFRQAGTCFCFLRWEWVLSIGAFDEDFGPGGDSRWQGGEDTDFLIRGLRRGMRLYRDPSVVVSHPDLVWSSSLKPKVVAYGVARMVLLEKHRYPLWFRISMVVYPIAALLRHPGRASYYLSMFRGRLQGVLLHRHSAAADS